jgi:hypothetical protein
MLGENYFAEPNQHCLTFLHPNLLYSTLVGAIILRNQVEILVMMQIQATALRVIAETNAAWANLVKRSVPAGALSLV